MHRTLTWTAALLLSLAAAAAHGQDAVAKTRLERDLEQLQTLRVEAAEDGVEACQAAFDAQTVSLTGLTSAMNELAAAQLDIAKTPNERIKALQSQVTRNEQLYTKIHQLYLGGARGGEAREEAHARAEVLKWQVLLTKELIKIESAK